MDPEACWDQLLAAYAAGEWDQIEERAADLLAWLDRGGFPPTIVRRPGIDADWNHVLARAGCLYALEIVRVNWSTKT